MLKDLSLPKIPLFGDKLPSKKEGAHLERYAPL